MASEKTYSRLLIIFSAFIASIWDYQFGGFDHLEHFPLLYRVEDPGYLSGDFFLNASEEGFDPRHYFSVFIAALHRILPLPLIYILLTFGVNCIIAVASDSAGRLLSGNEEDYSSGRVAMLLVMSVRTVDWGSVSEIHATYLTPNILAFALVLWAIVAAWRGQWLGSGLLCGIAALFHPLVGPESGTILFGFGFLRLVFRAAKGGYFNYFVGLSIWLLCSSLALMPYIIDKATPVAPELFFEIYAKLRTPHHILPSRFLNEEEWKNGIYLFLLLLVLVLQSLGSMGKGRNRCAIDLEVLAWLLVLLSLAYIGYYFVEVKFVKIVASAHLYRLLYLLKWLTLVYMGAAIGKELYGVNHRARYYAWVGLMTSFAWPNFLRLLLFRRLTDFLHRRYSTTPIVVFGELFFVLLLGGYSLYKAWETTDKYSDFYPWAIFMLLGILSHAIIRNNRLIYGFWAISSLSIFVFWYQNDNKTAETPIQKALQRRYSFRDLSPELLSLSTKIEELCPPDALLLSPPLLAELRYTARRALVVSFKTLPFKGSALAEWRQRLFDCYGWTDKEGFDAVLWAFEPQYKAIEEERLRLINEKYGADYAVLYQVSPTSFPVLYENSKYKLVYIGKP